MKLEWAEINFHLYAKKGFAFLAQQDETFSYHIQNVFLYGICLVMPSQNKGADKIFICLAFFKTFEVTLRNRIDTGS